MEQVVDMNRGTFDAIREKQQIDKYECENTYTLYINDQDDITYNDGVSDHDNFSVFIQPIGKEHIKNARCRLKFVGLPLQSSETFGYGYVRCNLTKNTIIGGSVSSGCLGAFKIEECRKLDIGDNNIPELATFAGKVDYTSPASAEGKLTNIAQTNKGQVPNGGNAAAPNDMVDVSTIGFDTAQVAPMPDVNRAAYTEKYYGEDVIACVGNPISDSWTSCNNPFGKQLDFSMMGEDIVASLQSGKAAGERTSIVLEVQLLPDNQANDKFTY